MSIQSIIVRCDSPLCGETADKMTDQPGWSSEERQVTASLRIVNDFCPAHTKVLILANARRAMSILTEQ